MSKEIIDFNPTGTCCKIMQISVEDGIIVDANFMGGCSGNLNAIKNLIKGMRLEEVIAKLKGITCGSKSTSCPDQLAICLTDYLANKIQSEPTVSA